MLAYYQEITLIPSPEIPLHVIWSKLFAQIHITLAEAMQGNEKGQIGVSFPMYRDDEVKTLGNKLRLFAAEEELLSELKLKQVLQRYLDYIHITSVRIIPNSVRSYANYQRIHSKSSQAQKARRYARRHNISVEEALQPFPKDHWKNEFPYIRLQSFTNKQPYRLYIKKSMRTTEESYGFNSYGLDNQSTIPVF